MPGKMSYKWFFCPRITKRTDRFVISKCHRLVVNRISGRTPSDGDFSATSVVICANRMWRDLRKQRKNCRHVILLHVLLSHPHLKHLLVHLQCSCHSLAQLEHTPPVASARGLDQHSFLFTVDIKHHIFISKEIIIPAGARCCPYHLYGNIGDLKPTTDTTTVNR